MSLPEEFHLSFEHQGTHCKIDLVKGVKGTPADHSVKINGIDYVVIGDDGILSTACEILKSVSLNSISNLDDLKNRLSVRGDISFPQKTNEIGIQTLDTKSVSKPQIGEWNAKEMTEILPNKRNFVGEKMWAKFQETHEKPSVLRGFLNLSEEEFDKAYENKDNLKKIFSNLTRDELEMIIGGEGLQRTLSSESITSKGICDLKQYMSDINFSGVISISDGQHVYTCKSENIPSLTTPFNLQSVTKVFTGVLSLLVFTKEDLDKPAQFDQTVIERYLPDSLQKHLENNKTTVRQLMTHTAGLGDHGVNYQDAMETGLLLKKFSELGLKIESPADFLRFAHEQIFKVDSKTFELSDNGVRARFVELLIMGLNKQGIITEAVLNQQFEVPNYLPIEVQEYFSKLESPLTLNKIIQAGLDEDLEKYKKIDFAQALEVQHAEELLKFADTKTYPVGDVKYSNLGMLLLGLSIEHYYNQKNGTKKEFREIVFDEIAHKAEMKSFTPSRPSNGRISPKDSGSGKHIYGDGSRCYWSTSEDLIKFGKWMNENAKGDFRSLIEKYGEEYHKRGVIKHAGDGDNSSAYFSTHLDSGITIAILSDQGESVATKMHDNIIDFMFSESLKIT